jgi:hypothetical protein
MSQDLNDDLPDGCVPVPSWVDEAYVLFEYPAFWTVAPALFTKEGHEATPYAVDIARILSDHSVKDITALEDARMLDTIVSILGSGSPLHVRADGYVQDPSPRWVGMDLNGVWNPPVPESCTS